MHTDQPVVVTIGNRTWTLLWWLCLFVAPAVLLAIELFHPAGFTHAPGMWQYLGQPQAAEAAHKALGYFGPEWWFTLHMIQTPMVALVCLGLWLMTASVGGQPLVAAAVAWLARIATFETLIYFTVLDGIGGIGLGRQILVAQGQAAGGQLSAEQLDTVAAFLNTMWVDPWVGGVGSVVSLTASWAVFLAAAFVALALLLTRRAPIIPLLLLAFGFGWQLQGSHAALNGPTAFASLIVAALWIWWHGSIRPGSPAPERITWI